MILGNTLLDEMHVISVMHFFIFLLSFLIFMFMQEKQVDHMSRLKEKVSTPEGVPRLFDLIKVQDERMKLAFFAAMGNTVVAKDIDQVFSLLKLEASGENQETTH